jgi:hypothetical protein
MEWPRKGSRFNCGKREEWRVRVVEVVDLLVALENVVVLLTNPLRDEYE